MKKSLVLPPTDGIFYQMEETYLSNIKNGEVPHGEPVEFYLFVDRFVRKESRHFVHTIQAATEHAALEQLKEFASRHDVFIVQEKTRNPVPKEWIIEKELA